MQKKLIISGTALLLIGLILGTILDWFASHTLASDAHVAGVQHGMLLMLLGLAWNFAKFEKLATSCGASIIVGLYGIFFAFLIGAIIGDPYPSASTSTYVIFVVSSGILILGISLFLIALIRAQNLSD